MFRKSLFALLLIAAVFSVSVVQQAFAAESQPAGQLIGSWKITHRPVNAAGKPCPFLPETIEFFKDQTLSMSNIPGLHMPFKTDLTPAEMKAFEARSKDYQGKSLLLVKPNPKMEWQTTPMAYVYAATKDALTLTVQGWEPATFKRMK